VSLVACAKLAGLEDSEDPLANGTSGGVKPGNTSSSSSGGTATLDSVEISPTTLDINSPCGTPSGLVSLRLNNTGDKPVEYEIKAPDNAIISLKDNNGANVTVVKDVVNAGQLAQIPIQLSSPTPAKVETELIVSALGRTQVIKTTATVTGGMLVVSPPLIDFGQVRQNTTTLPQIVELTNTGNETITIQGWTGGSADFTMSTGSINIPPTEKRTASVTFVPAPAGAPLTTEFVPSPLAPVCGGAKPLQLKGHRIDTNVTVSPATADMGGVNCNSSPNLARRITVSNFSSANAAVVVLSLAKGAGSPFRLSTPGFTIPIAPSGEKLDMNFDVIANTPISGTPGQQTDTVNVAISGAENFTRTVNVSMNVEGALLEINPTTLNTFTASSTKRSFNVRNVGNKQLLLDHRSSNNGEFSVQGGSGFPVPPNFTVGVEVELKNTGSGMHAADITTVRANPIVSPFENGQLCAPAPVVKASANL